jgi:hypothetical protein
LHESTIPKNQHRSSETIMLEQENPDHDPIRSRWITAQVSFYRPLAPAQGEEQVPQPALAPGGKAAGYSPAAEAAACRNKMGRSS